MDRRKRSEGERPPEERPQEERPQEERPLYDASKSPLPDSDVVPVDPNPEHFHTARIAFAVQGVLLLVLGGWGLIASTQAPPGGISGAPVLFFHFTWGHSVVLIGTALLSIACTRRYRWGFWFAVVQGCGYLLLYVSTMGDFNWISDRADNALHGALGIAGVGFLLWIAARGMTEWHWVVRPSRRTEGSAPRARGSTGSGPAR